MKRSKIDSGPGAVDRETLIPDATTDAHGDDEQRRALRPALEDGVERPCDAFIIGEPILVLAFEYDGDPRRGIVVR